jgi:hypothetical protein
MNAHTELNRVRSKAYRRGFRVWNAGGWCLYDLMNNAGEYVPIGSVHIDVIDKYLNSQPLKQEGK